MTRPSAAPAHDGGSQPGSASANGGVVRIAVHLGGGVGLVVVLQQQVELVEREVTLSAWVAGGAPGDERDQELHRFLQARPAFGGALSELSAIRVLPSPPAPTNTRSASRRIARPVARSMP